MRQKPHPNLIKLHDILRKSSNIVAIEELCGTKGIACSKTLAEVYTEDNKSADKFKISELTA